MLIEVPSKLSEFDIQADLYSDLKKLGYIVGGEVSAKTSLGKIRIDIVVFKRGSATVLIEVKDSEYLTLLNGKQSRQIRKYKDCEIPFILYTTTIPKEVVIEIVHKIMDEAPITDEDKYYKGMRFLYN